MRRSLVPWGALPTFGLTVVRIALGVWWLSQFSWKPLPNFGCPNEGFCVWLDKEIQYPLLPLYADMVRAIIRPNAVIFGWFSFLVETALGLGFVFGILTRIAGFVGALWSINLLVGLLAVPGETSWYYVSMILLDFLYFAVGGYGQISIDRAANWRSWWARAS